jgi:hypothetical protein
MAAHAELLKSRMHKDAVWLILFAMVRFKSEPLKKKWVGNTTYKDVLADFDPP